MAHAVALDGLGQDDGGLAGVLGGRFERCVHLVGVVTTTVQTPDIVGAHAADHFQQFAVFAEEILAYNLAVVRLVGLVFAVYGLFHVTTQLAFFIACQEGILVDRQSVVERNRV